MTDSEPVLVSRSDIARLAGVRRPAVSNWERRHPDFPDPVLPEGTGEAALFRATEVLAWLASRRIPSDVRQDGEPDGWTYADRFARNSVGVPPQAENAGKKPSPQERSEDTVHPVVSELMGPMADRFRRGMLMGPYLEWVLGLLFLRVRRPAEWRAALSGESDLTGFLSWVTESLDSDPELRPAAGERSSWLLEPEPHLLVLGRLVNRLSPGAESAARAFDMLISQYAESESARTAEFVTPGPVVRAIAGIAAEGVHAKRISDPFCRTGELLTAVAREHRGTDGEGTLPDIEGGSPSKASLRIAHINLALHGLTDCSTLRLTPVPPWLDGPPRTADIVVANPPFNMRAEEAPDFPWRYGRPPRHSSNFAWLQYMVAALRPGGRAVTVMANSAVSSDSLRERDIRRRMVDDGAVECLIALPPQLFLGTAIAATLWVLRHPPGSCEDGVRFVDATRLGSMTSRIRRVLSADDITQLITAFRTPGTTAGGAEQVPSRLVGLAEIQAHDYMLAPALYTGTSPGGLLSPNKKRLEMQATELTELHARAATADATVDRLLKEILR